MDKNEECMELIPLFKSVYKNMKNEWYRQMDDNLTNTQFSILYKLSQLGVLKPSDLANILRISSSTVTSIADKLCEKRLISRERCENDRRVVHLQITEQGNAIVELNKNNEQIVIKSFLNRLSQEELRHLKQIFTKMIE